MSKTSNIILLVCAAAMFAGGFTIAFTDKSASGDQVTDTCNQFERQGKKVIRAGGCYVEIGPDQYLLSMGKGHVYTREEILDKVR